MFSGFQSLEVNVNFDLQIVPALASVRASKVTFVIMTGPY